MATDPIPHGYHSVTPFLAIQNIPQFIEFAKRAFGAKEIHRLETPDGSVIRAEIRIGDSIIKVGSADPGPTVCKGSLYLYVHDADIVYENAINAGAMPIESPRDQFYGDHAGGIKDPCGNQWWIATHVEDVPEDQLKKRAAQWEAERGEAASLVSD